MAVFNTNQVRHLFVAKADKTSGTLADVGDVQVKKVTDGLDTQAYLLYQGPDTVVKSDYIPVANITQAKAVAAADMAYNPKKVTVTLDSDVSSTVVAGQDYILRIAFRQFYGMSDEDQYFKDVAVRGTTAMASDVSVFYAALESALNLAFSREVGATASSNPYLSFSSSASGLVITEKEQEWTLGTQASERVYFDVFPTTIYVDGDDQIWGEVTVATDTTTTIGNGKRIADLEYFCMGERGDQYRYVGWPNYIPTTYVADATQQFDVIEIHYSFKDSGVNSYKTEKDLTIAVPAGTAGTTHTVTNAILASLRTATGLTSTQLPDLT